MAEETYEVLERLSDDYADRMSTEQGEEVDVRTGEHAWSQAVFLVVCALASGGEVVTPEEFSELEHLVEVFDLDGDLLDELVVA